MMKCKSCGHLEAGESAKFCGKCGKTMELMPRIRCRKCNADLGVDVSHIDRFCNNCGAPTKGPIPGETTNTSNNPENSGDKPKGWIETLWELVGTAFKKS